MTFDVRIDAGACKGCGLCINFCPKHILEVDEAVVNRIGAHPTIITHKEVCIGCLSCALMCPDCAITIDKLEGMEA